MYPGGDGGWVSLELTQQEADLLIALEKHRVDEQVYTCPLPGGKVIIPLQSHDGAEEFLLDVTRGAKNVIKVSLQNRCQGSVVLVRFCNAVPHRNPDDEVIPPPHIHLYREGYADKWAMPLPVGQFSNVADVSSCVIDFMTLCNVTVKPNFTGALIA